MERFIIILAFIALSCTNQELVDVPAVILEEHDRYYVLRHPNAVQDHLTYKYPKKYLSNYCIGDTIQLQVRKSISTYYGK